MTAGVLHDQCLSFAISRCWHGGCAAMDAVFELERAVPKLDRDIVGQHEHELQSS